MSPGPVSDSYPGPPDGSGERLNCAFCGELLVTSPSGPAPRQPVIDHALLCDEHPLGKQLRRLDATPWTRAVMQQVARERRRQEEKWGEQNHDPFLYLTILGEEYGEACEAALRCRFPGGGELEETLREQAGYDLRRELVQIAAVAVAAIECLERGTWNWGGHALQEEGS